MKIDKRIRIRYRGNVQGVGFRFAVCRQARHFDIGGFVRNEPDGSVLMVAEGGPGGLDSFLDAIDASSVAAHIRGKSIEEEEYRGEFDEFRIEY